ncbi:DUF2087 domain-containing protein [uncultured Roseobacter sp.]|uniref:DUF2087 domain-containing protein n=1 Tax=uncultured Roseobacter sp. TaxID=114847 RepID=UPI002610E125|nr:DUF2087 domain-containing protein [uncultured Roseobacter sp.]
MPKTPLPLRAGDLTTFVRALSKQLGDASPSHLSLMNMAARAAGYQNVQHMRSAHAAAQRLSRAADDPPHDARAVERALHQFDATGRLDRWPSKRSVQTLALWALWATLPADRSMPEREVNERLAHEHLFNDPATLRRTMVSCALLSRRRDGTDYRRIEQEPSAEAKALITALAARRRARPQEAVEVSHV